MTYNVFGGTLNLAQRNLNPRWLVTRPEVVCPSRGVMLSSINVGGRGRGLGVEYLRSLLWWPTSANLHRPDTPQPDHTTFLVVSHHTTFNEATGFASQHIWCLSQARRNWEGCARKGIRRKNGGMAEMAEMGHRSSLDGVAVHSDC